RFQTYSKLPGTPDIVLRDANVAVFVHGCFWHGCPRHYRLPKRNHQYWIPKLERNQARDRANTRALRRLGWSVVTTWECAVKKDVGRVCRRVSMAKSRALLRHGEGQIPAR